MKDKHILMKKKIKNEHLRFCFNFIISYFLTNYIHILVRGSKNYLPEYIHYYEGKLSTLNLIIF